MVDEFEIMCEIYFFFILVMIRNLWGFFGGWGLLGIRPMASHLLGKHSIMEQIPPTVILQLPFRQ
jgi:hypothetical protein